MTSSDIFLISPLLCKNITIQTTEKISSSNIYNFLTTSIQSNDINLQINERIFYFYISESNIYEIYIISIANTYIQTYANIFKYYYKDKIDSIDLFITNDYFAIYKNSKLYFFKENKNYEIEDIKSFVKYKYKLEINNINIINKDQIKNYQEKFIINNKEYIKFVKPKQSKFYLYYIFYLLLLVLLVVGYEIKNKPKVSENNNKIVYKKNNEIIYDIVKLCNIYKLQIENLSYNNKYHLKIVSKNKKNLDKFISFYKNSIKIKNIYKNKNRYILEFEIEQ